jgi:hypothetical protein
LVLLFGVAIDRLLIAAAFYNVFSHLAAPRIDQFFEAKKKQGSCY